MLASTRQAAKILRNGGVVAYPTESCYGLGCDPNNPGAIRRILHIKRRSRSKGLILIADNLSRLRFFVKNIPPQYRQEILDSWPGPYTWLLPARTRVSHWLRGDHPSIAVRITAHRYAKALCCAADMAIVSTSANRSRRRVLRCAARVGQEFGGEIDCIMEGHIGLSRSPSVIRDGLTGELVRN